MTSSEARVERFWDLLTGESGEDVSPMRFLFSDARGPLDSRDTHVEEFEPSGKMMLVSTGLDCWFGPDGNRR